MGELGITRRAVALAPETRGRVRSDQRSGRAETKLKPLQRGPANQTNDRRRVNERSRV